MPQLLENREQMHIVRNKINENFTEIEIELKNMELAYKQYVDDKIGAINMALQGRLDGLI